MKYLSAIFLGIALALSSCNSDSVDDAIDIVEGVPRKDINKGQVGVNCFFNDGRFGSIPAQFAEVRNTLDRRFVRVLFAWNNDVQPSPSASPNFSFYDQIINNIPEGMDALVLLTDVPSWMADPANWINGNPRTTFNQLWVKKVVERYGRSPRIIGWQIWNEPNMPNRADNNVLQVETNPANFVELVAGANSIAKGVAPGKFVVNGATTAINQNFPGTINYNAGMRDAGIESFVDVYAIHYYGKQFENVVRPGGVEEFLDSVNRRVWITESGEQGLTNQQAYAEQVWPYLNEKIGKIDRIYAYQMFEATPSGSTYALRNLESISDLYTLLRAP